MIVLHESYNYHPLQKENQTHLCELEQDQDILILSGAKCQGFVVLTLDQYNALEETTHLLSTPANATHLLESIKQDRAGKSESKIHYTLKGIPTLKKHRKTFAG
jgi:antitoxin YefM